MRSRLGFIIIVALIAIGAWQSTTRAQSNTTQTGNKEIVRLGYVPVLIYSPLYVAAERGYFAQEGIDAQLTPLQGGSDSVVQLAAGNFDAAVGGVGAGLLNAANKGLQFRIVAPMHVERPPIATSLVISAARANEIKSVADLKGKKVSINATGAATEYWLGEALRKNGLTFQDIILTTIAFKDVPAALASGAIDAAMLGEPLTTQQADKGIVKVLADDFIDGFTSTYLYMGLPLIQDRPQVAEGFLRAYLRACRDLQGDAFKDKDIASIIEKYTKVPAEVIQRASHAYYDPNGVIPVKDIETLQSYFLARGELDYKTPQDINPLVDSSLGEKAVKALGVYAMPTSQATMAATAAK